MNRIQKIGVGVGMVTLCQLPLMTVRAQTWDLRTGQRESSQNLLDVENSGLVAGAQEWRLDGRVTGIDNKQDAFALQSDVTVMRDNAAGQDLDSHGSRVLIDRSTQMWTPDGKVQPFTLSALRVGSEIMAIGSAQYHPRGTRLFARLIVLPNGLPADFTPSIRPQKLARKPLQSSLSRRAGSEKRTPRHLQVLAPRIIDKPQRRARVAAPRPTEKPIVRVKTPENKARVARTISPNVAQKPNIARKAPMRTAQLSRSSAPRVQIVPQPQTDFAFGENRAAPLSPSRASVPQTEARLVSPPQLSRAQESIDEARTTTARATEANSASARMPSRLSAATTLSGGVLRRVPPHLSASTTRSARWQGKVAAHSVETENTNLPAGTSSPRLKAPRAPARLAGTANVAPIFAAPAAPRAASPVRNMAALPLPESRATLPARAMTMPSLAPRDTRTPQLSRAQAPLLPSRVLQSAEIAPPVASSSDFTGTRALSPLPDTLQVLAEANVTARAQTRFAALRQTQNSVAWSTFSGGSPDGEKLVALTFDDGPHPRGTTAILEILRREKAPATFFVVGRNVQKHPDIVRRMAADGHDIANHSFHHVQGRSLSASQWREEISANNRVLEEILGVAPRWFRAPGCRYPIEALNALGELEMVRADSTNNSGDWHQPNANAIVAGVLGRLEPMQVLLFHDPLPQTARALPILLHELRRRGYTPVTLTELARRAAQNPRFVPLFHPPGQGIVLAPEALRAQTVSQPHTPNHTPVLPADAPALLQIEP